MKEVMIPDLFWDNEYWCIKTIDSMSDLDMAIKYADGSIKNLIVEINSRKDYERHLENTFKNYKWIEKILIKHRNKVLGVFNNKAK